MAAQCHGSLELTPPSTADWGLVVYRSSSSTLLTRPHRREPAMRDFRIATMFTSSAVARRWFSATDQ